MILHVVIQREVGFYVWVEVKSELVGGHVDRSVNKAKARLSVHTEIDKFFNLSREMLAQNEKAQILEQRLTQEPVLAHGIHQDFGVHLEIQVREEDVNFSTVSLRRVANLVVVHQNAKIGLVSFFVQFVDERIGRC